MAIKEENHGNLLSWDSCSTTDQILEISMKLK